MDRPRCGCYLRVSTDQQTVENQRADVERLARARGLEPVWYQDEESALKHRPGLESMMGAARRGELAAVVIWALDRLHRSRAAGAHLVEQLDRWGVPLVSVREAWLDTTGPARELLIQIMLWLAQGERERLIERTLAGLDRARRQGVRLGRPPTSPIMIRAAADLVTAGASIRGAAAAKGVSASALSRFMRAANGSGGPVEGPAGSEGLADQSRPP
jgi:DNA invertase Pin-like site-specific DNA recombinase